MQQENQKIDLKPNAESTSFTIEMLKMVKESQQLHGLRHKDYQRYRSYCTRRVRRLRKTLHFVCGTSRRFQKKEINIEEVNDSKFLLIPLYQAERAWAYAMQLKQEINDGPRKRFHLANRLRKAVKHAQELEKLSQSNKCDARTKLEAQGYLNLMSGQLFFELQKWNESLKSFEISKKIYGKLAAALKGDESQIFYTQKVEEISPNIRYCNYNLGDESAKKDLIDMKLNSATGSNIAESIDILISQTKEKQITSLSEIVWKNKISLQIKSEKVRLFLLNVQEYEKQIQETSDLEVKISIYENILRESIDAIQLVRDELKTDQLFQSMQRGQPLTADDKPSNLLLLFAYLTSIRTNKTIERNKLLINSYKSILNKSPSATNNPNESLTTDGAKTKNVKPQDIVRLYDLIIQNYKDLSNLPGLISDKQYQSDTETLMTYYKAFKAYYITLFYLANKRFKEAVGFCFKVEKYLKELREKLKALSNNSELISTREEMKKEMDYLANELNNSKYKIQTSALLESGSDSVEDKLTDHEKEKLSKIPLTERMDVYFEDLNLVNKNPCVTKMVEDFEPIPCKPIFFDLALNHVELPTFVEESKQQQQQQSQQGVRGFFKGMFGF